MRKCNKENMTKLVEELETGNRNQANGVLRDDIGYCCLGVACDISGVGEWKYDGMSYIYVTDKHWSIGSLTTAVMNWLGIDTEDPYANMLIVEGAGATYASDLNDGGKSFAEIAKAIRETYLEGNDQ
jgi:hypothetical protein